VMRIERTATESMTWLPAMPAARGTEPRAACTVAFGSYAKRQNSRSRREKPLLKEVASQTPTERAPSPAKINRIPRPPVSTAVEISTAIPISTIATISRRRVFSVALIFS